MGMYSYILASLKLKEKKYKTGVLVNVTNIHEFNIVYTFVHSLFYTGIEL